MRGVFHGVLKFFARARGGVQRDSRAAVRRGGGGRRRRALAHNGQRFRLAAFAFAGQVQTFRQRPRRNKFGRSRGRCDSLCRRIFGRRKATSVHRGLGANLRRIPRNGTVSRRRGRGAGVRGGSRTRGDCARKNLVLQRARHGDKGQRFGGGRGVAENLRRKNSARLVAQARVRAHTRRERNRKRNSFGRSD